MRRGLAAYTLPWWRERARSRLHAAIAAALPWLVQRSLRRDLAGVWGVDEAGAPEGGCVVVANHHSWWDGYLAWYVARRAERPFAVLVDAATLRRYPFFERQGAVDALAVRRAAARARAGAWLFVFPEGRIGPARRVAPFARGAGVIAGLAGVPIVPMAWRVVVRGGQYPEVYVRRGAALADGATPERQRAAVCALLERIDADLDAADDPERPLASYAPWHAGRRSTHERVARWRAWWGE